MTVHHSDWYAQTRPEYFVEGRRFGAIDMTQIKQPSGAFPDPPAPYWQIQLVLDGEGSAALDFGDGPWRDSLAPGQIAVSTVDTTCDYDVDGDHEVLALSLPKDCASALLQEVDTVFANHFGQLHAHLWRDNAIRDLMLTIWRASKGDRHAPDLDPDEALIQLSLMLLKRSNEKFTPKDFAYRLSPAVRRRVTEFVDDHIDETLPLFRLAEVAGLSPYHFARAFRADIGDTPAQYVRRRRLAKAQDLIRDTDLPFTEIAMAAGFSSQSRLNDAFAREIGGTPTQMRRELRR